MGALKAVYGRGRTADAPLVIGAVKSNIGHLEGAAGMAGLIKAVLVLQHSAVPPNLHMRNLNPKLDLNGFPTVFPSSLTQISRDSLAAVSSCGFGGANAHVVLSRGDAVDTETLAMSITGPAQLPSVSAGMILNHMRLSQIFMRASMMTPAMCGMCACDQLHDTSVKVHTS